MNSRLRGSFALTIFASGVLGSASTPAAQAQVKSTPVFSGNLSETWESFPNFLDGGFHLLPDPVSVFNGQGTFSNSNSIVYEPFAADALLGLSGFAETSDGVKGVQVGNLDSTATLAFSNPVQDFGAYFGAETFGGATTISIDFFGISGNSLGSAAFDYDHETLGDGELDWHGWHSSDLIGSVSITGSNFVLDGLQANAVPEPNSVSLLVGGICGYGVLRFKRLRRQR